MGKSFCRKSLLRHLRQNYVCMKFIIMSHSVLVRDLGIFETAPKLARHGDHTVALPPASGETPALPKICVHLRASALRPAQGLELAWPELVEVAETAVRLFTSFSHRLVSDMRPQHREFKLLNLRHFNGGASMRVRGFVGRQGHGERLHGVVVVG